MIKKFSLKMSVLGFAVVLAFCAPAFSAQCKDNGVDMFCQWKSSCNRVEDTETEDCAYKIQDCRNSGELYRGVDVTKLTKDNNYGDGLVCSQISGSEVDPPKYCYFLYSNPVGRCEKISPLSGIKDKFYCENHDDRGVLVSNCGAAPSLLCTWGPNECVSIPGVYYGMQVQSAKDCFDNYGLDVIVNGTCPTVGISSFVRLKSTASPLRASYAKGGISVDWNAGSTITGGVISLVNIKGVTVASAPAAAGGSTVNAKLRVKSTLPTGMYFVRVDVLGVSGKRTVQQVPVNIVK